VQSGFGGTNKFSSTYLRTYAQNISFPRWRLWICCFQIQGINAENWDNKFHPKRLPICTTIHGVRSQKTFIRRIIIILSIKFISRSLYPHSAWFE
jgi:hypothetical protein